MNRLYLKLLITITAGALILTFIILNVFRLKIEERKSEIIKPGYRDFLRYMINEINQNTTEDTLEQLGDKHNLYIKVKKENWVIYSNPAFFSSNEFRKIRKRPEKSRMRETGRRHSPPPHAINFLFKGKIPAGIEIISKNTSYIFVHKPDRKKDTLLLSILVLGITIVLFVIGLLVHKWYASPLNTLEKALREFSSNIYTDNTISARGELEKLFRAFNTMKTEVKSAMESRERMLRDISHDLRSPITRMKVALELLEDSPVKDKLKNDINDLSSLVNQIMETETSSEALQETIDMDGFFRDFISSSGENIHFYLDVKENFKVMGNPGYFKRIFTNLTDNSKKYAQIEKGIRIKLERSEGTGLITFSDSSQSFNPDILTRIFDPFFKEDSSRRQDKKEGSGLGLTICRHLVQSMGGQITAELSQTGGLSVVLKFPLI